MSDSKYPTHIEPRLLEVAMWVREGRTEREIARKLGVSYSSFREHKKAHPALLGTLMENKGMVDAKVENALLQKALGQKIIEVTRERKYDRAQGKEAIVVTKEIEKEIPPELGAIKLWLTNRKRKQWSENPQGNQYKERELELKEKELESKDW